MTLILDAGGVSGLTGQRARLAELRRRGLWPAQVPAVVLAETLCRDAARLRTSTGRAGTISATDAVVVAYAEDQPDPVVLTSDPGDLNALAAGARRRRVTVVAV